MADPKIVSRFEKLLQPYSTERVQLPFYELSRISDKGRCGVQLVDFRLSGATAISFHFDLDSRTFRVVEVGPGPEQVGDFDALIQVFDRAKAFIQAAQVDGFLEGEVRF